MNKTQAQKEIKKLSEELEDHNYKYYQLSQPTISDTEYDQLLRRLIELETLFPQLKNRNSPSQRVGVKVASGGNTVKHKVKMYSLDNTYSFDEIAEWHKRVIKGLDHEDS